MILPWLNAELKTQKWLPSLTHTLCLQLVLLAPSHKNVSSFNQRDKRKKFGPLTWFLAAVYRNCVDILIFCPLMVTWFKQKFCRHTFFYPQNIWKICVFWVFLWLPDLKAIFKEVVSDWWPNLKCKLNIYKIGFPSF